MRRLAALTAAAVLLLALVLGSRPMLQTDAQGATPAASPGASPAACPTTTPQQNVALVEQWYVNVFNERDTGLIPSLLAPDYVRHRPGAQVANQPGTADDVRFVKLVLTEFPDLHVTVNDVVAAGDRVAIRTTFAGTQRAPLTDQGGAPATNRRMSRDNIAIWRVACGRLAEQWIVSDFLTELRQLGIVSNAELASVGPPTVATPAAIPSAASPVALTPAATGAAVGSPAATCPTTTPDQNEAIARRWFEDVWNGRDLALADAVLADNVMFHYPGRPDLNPAAPYPPHNAADIQRIRNVLAEFPDLHITIDDMFAAGDQVAVRMTWSGTQQGPLKDLGVPATGRPTQWEVIVILRMQCGQIAEQWIASDDLTMLEQLGSITADELKTAGPPEVATPAA